MAVDLSGRNPNVNDGVVQEEPLHKNIDASGQICGLAEFKTAEAIAIKDGGTGAITAEGARLNLEVFSETEVTDLIVHNIKLVNADTEAKDYEQILVDTTTNDITITLPAPQADRETVVVQDASNNAQNHPITVDGNGKTINGFTEVVIDENNARYVFIYQNGEWRLGR